MDEHSFCAVVIYFCFRDRTAVYLWYPDLEDRCEETEIQRGKERTDSIRRNIGRWDIGRTFDPECRRNYKFELVNSKPFLFIRY